MTQSGAVLTVTSISPTSIPVGAASTTLTVSGTGFGSSTTLQVGGTLVPSSFINPTQITAQIPANLLASGGVLSVVAVDGTASSSSSAAAVNLTVDNPMPSVGALNPGTITAGSAATTVLVTGTGFVSTTVIQVNGTARSTSFVTPTQVSVALTVADLATVGGLSLTAVNATPGGGASPAITLPVTNPAPGTITINPASIVVGSTAAGTITVTGSNFVASSVAQLNGLARATSVQSATQLSFQLTAADKAVAATLALTVATPAPGGGVSAPAAFVVANPIPALNTIAPSVISRGGSVPVTVALNGSNFVSTTVVQVNGAARTTSFVSAGQLTFQLTPTDQATSGTISIIASTPAPGGGSSQTLSLAVLANPVLSLLSPATALLDSPTVMVTVAGSGFTPADIVSLGTQALPTTYVSAQALQATLAASSLTSVATLNLSVHDPNTIAAASNSLPFSVINPVPVVASYSPVTLPTNSGDTSVVLNGTNFNSTSIVLLGATPLKTSFVSTTQLTALLPAANLATQGLLSLTVSNPVPQGGTSGAVTIAVVQLAPQLSALTPSSSIGGSTPVPVTIMGKNFTPTAMVYYGYYPVATTYLSSTSLQFTFPASAVGSASTYSVSVRDPASGNRTSNSLTFQVLNPVPTLSSISPADVTAGAPNFSLTLTGTNLLSSTTVLINGIPHTVYGSGKSLTVTVAASEVTSVGPVSVTAVNPMPGGGSSNGKTLQVISANNRVRTVNAAAAALGWDAAHGLVLAATYASSSISPTSLIAIDPLQGTIVSTQSLPVEPDSLAVSDDGSYVYVSLPTAGQVGRFLLPSLAQDITFSLGKDASGNPYRAESLSVAPGHPHTVALSRHSQGYVLGANGGVAVYDDGVPRPTIAFPTNGVYDNYDALVWGADNTTLYGTDDYISTALEDVFTVNANGVTLASSTGGVLSQFVQNLSFDSSTNRLIDGFGAVVNAVTKQSTGTLPLQEFITYEPNPFTVDTTQRKAYYLIVNGVTATGTTSGLAIEAFNIDQYTYLNTINVPGLSSGGSLIRWGTSGLAVDTSTQIFFIDGSFVSPNGVASPLGSYVAPSPTLTSVVPAAVPVGSPDTQLTLTGKDFSLASVVSWNNQTLPIDSATDTQLTLTVPAGMLTSAIASALTVTNGPGTSASGPLGFTVLPNLGPNLQLSAVNVSGQDIVWDATRGLLYVAVPATDSVFANSIAVVDPIQSAVQNSVPVLDQPSALSLSSDSKYLYAGFYGNAVLQRLNLPSFALDLTIPLGAGVSTPAGGRQSCTFAIAVKAAPGSPQTVAVDQGNRNIEPRGCGALAIFDNATPRQNTNPYSSGRDTTSLAWGSDATTLFGQSDPAFQSQSLSKLSIAPAGVALRESLGAGNLGSHVHFDSGTGFLYSDSGLITNPAGPSTVANLSSGTVGSTPYLLLPDSTLNRAYLLVANPGQTNNNSSSSYTLEVFDLTKLTLLNSVILPAILGTPSQMVRWGANGLAITTQNPNLSSSGPGTLYLLQGSTLAGP